MLERFIASLENTPMSVATWLAGFAGIVWIRCFLEVFSSPNVSGYVASDLPTLLSYGLWYLAVALMLVTIVSIFSRTAPLCVARALLFVLPVLWLGPLIDLCRGGASIGYIFAVSPQALLYDFLTYFGPLAGSGATFGLRVEIACALLILGGYVYVRTKQPLRALLALVAGYLVIFIAGSLPSLIGLFFPVGAGSGASAWVLVLQGSLIARDFLHPSEIHSAYRTAELLFDAAMAQTWYLFVTFTGLVLLYRAQKHAVIATLRNLRPERLAHYIIAAILGGLIALAEGSRVSWNILDIITIAVAALTITFAWLFAITINDIVDEPIDAISNKERPLITGMLTPSTMRDVVFVSGAMTLVGALALGSYATFWVLAFSACAFIYSTPPLRLKRVPILASAFIGVATLSLVLLGFFLVSANQTIIAFPAPLAFAIFLSVTLMANVRDLKDIQGDAAAHIWTIPTLLGERRARFVIGGMCCLAALIIPLFIPVLALWVPSVITGVVAWVSIVRGEKENFLFSLYFLYLASVILILAFS